MRLLTLKTILPAAALLTVAACSQSDRWHVSGTVDGADGQLMQLERSYNGNWYTLDSLRLTADGKFEFSQEPTGYPDIYRLTIDGRSLYFPIDSINDITVTASMPEFDSRYTVGGSLSADMMQSVNEKVAAAIARNGVAGAVTDETLKRELSGMILGDQSGIVSYYIINKSIGTNKLFNPADKGDLRIIGAVANAFSNFRPDDPRTPYITNLYLGYRRAMSLPADTVVATELTFFDMSLLDENGKQQSLSDIAGKGRPVIVNFTSYAAEASPAFNIELAKAYNTGGVDIYQVSVDTDEFMWRDTAKNLPWTTVLNTPKDGTRNLVNYNVNTLPATFILDRNGNIVERVTDITRLADSIRKYK